MNLSNSPKPQNLGRTYRPWIDEKITPTEFGHVSMQRVKTEKLGDSDMSITPVGFGAWAIGGTGWRGARGPQDDKEKTEIEAPSELTV